MNLGESYMKRFKRWFRITIMSVIVILAFIFTYHQFCLKNENLLLKPMGELVTVNNHKMSIYVTGNGPETLVLLSGAGTVSPILDFQDLSNKLATKYRVVVVERLGYGYSDDTSESRDVKNVLSETRQALSKAQISGPYIIISHSLSCLESLLWQEKYPNEVKALIGLDWALPDSYANIDVSNTLVNLAYFSSKLGLLRYFPDSFYIQNPNLSSQEKRIYRMIAYRQLMSQSMLNETLMMKSNANEVGSQIDSNIPVLMFVSNGEGTNFSKEDWRNYAKNFAKNQHNINIIYYNVPHYLYHYKTKDVDTRIEEFIDS